jgi:glutathione peroxidase
VNSIEKQETKSHIRSFYDLTAYDPEGRVVPLSKFEGYVSLVVNTASRCGFTSQYRGLEKLYQDFKDDRFVVLAFPSNDFGGQEPGTNSEIREFCDLRYRITFPIFAKDSVTGIEKQPVYKFLTEESGDCFKGDPGWNFVKFLVNRRGEVIGRFSALTRPSSTKLIRAIRSALGDT